MKETIGKRLYQIRREWGDGRDPETLDDFAVRVKKKTGVSYNPVTLSLLERMKRKWRVADVENFAAVDRMERGPAWLAGWADASDFEKVIPRGKAATATEAKSGAKRA